MEFFTRTKEYIAVSNGGEMLVFNTPRSSKRRPEEDPYREINLLLGLEDGDFRARLFEIYRKAEVVVSDCLVRYDQVALSSVVGELVELVSMERIRSWCNQANVIRAPRDIKDVFDPSEPNMTADKTYTTSDYIGLGHLVVLTRFLLPIWAGVSCSTLTRNSSRSVWFNTALFSTLQSTPLYFHDSLARLRRYVASWDLDESRANQVAVLGISVDDFPDWLVAEVVVERAPFLVLDAGDGKGFVKDIYKETVSFTKADTGRGRIDTKDYTPGGADGSNHSQAEEFKTKMDISPGEVATFSAYCRDTLGAARAMVPDVDLELYENCMRDSRDLLSAEIQFPQATLVEWVYGGYVSCKAVRYISADVMTGMLGVVRAVLITKGYPELAAMASASGVYNESAALAGMSEFPTLDQRKEIKALYPIKPSTGKSDSKDHQVLALIDKLYSSIQTHDWYYKNQRLSLKKVKSELIDLVLEIGRGKFMPQVANTAT